MAQVRLLKWGADTRSAKHNESEDSLRLAALGVGVPAPDAPGISLGGALHVNVTTITGHYAVQPGDYFISAIPPNAGGLIVNLPATPVVGRTLVIKNSYPSPTEIVINAMGDYLIDGGPSLVITAAYGVKTLVFTGAYWAQVF